MIGKSEKRGLMGKWLITAVLLGIISLVVGFGGNKTEAKALEGQDFLKTDRTLIKNAKGQEVQLRGVNAGGWLVQEEWMNPTNAKDQKTMMDTFKNRFGAAGRDELIKVYEDNYWTTKDFDNVQNMGANVLRLPFTYMNLVDYNGNLKADAWNRLDWFIDNSAKRGMYVILDMHGAFGSQNGMDHSGEINDGKQLYDNPANRAKTLWLWEKIAEHYNGNPAVAGYDTINEPGIKAAATNKVQWDFYDEIYKKIRNKDKEHIVIMESCWDAKDLPRPQTYNWTNIVYEYHYYPWSAEKDLAAQKKYFDSKVVDINQANYNVPTFIGEFNVFGLTDGWKYALNTFNTNRWSWTSWSYKVTGTNNNWGIYNHNPAKVDIYNDSKEVIKQKWSNVRTEQGAVNQSLYNVIKEGFQGGVATIQDGKYYLVSSANNKVVTAEDAGNKTLAANRDNYGGAWETLLVKNNSDGTVSFQSEANGKYVTAVLDEQSQLLARASTIGDWEKFRFVPTGNGDYGIQSAANNKFVSANLNNGGQLFATQNLIGGAWEAFKVNKVN